MPKMGTCSRCGGPAVVQEQTIGADTIQIALCGKDRHKASLENAAALSRRNGTT